MTTKYITFHEAMKLLQCQPDWLSRQIERGKIQTQVVPKNEHSLETRYLLLLEDVEQLASPPTCTRGELRPAQMRELGDMRRKAELIREAREAGMTLDDYLRVVYGSFA